jgi:hypothetical protein
VVVMDEGEEFEFGLADGGFGEGVVFVTTHVVYTSL